MRWRKYIFRSPMDSLRGDFVVFGLRYEERTGTVSLGGPSRFREKYLEIIWESFIIGAGEEKWKETGRGQKGWYSFRYNKDDFFIVLDMLCDRFHCREVKSFGRLIR